MLAENKKDKFIAARIRKVIFKIISKVELSKETNSEAVGVIEISTKFINMIVPRRDPNIVYEDLIEDDPILSKIIIAKIIPNEDKPSYEITMVNSEAFQ
jgi:hypothetical protein